MTLHTIRSADRIYSLGENLRSPKITGVHHEAFNSFLKTLNRLSSYLADDANEFPWEHFFKLTRRLARALIWNPLSLDFSEPLGSQWEAYSENFCSRCRTTYPGAYEILCDLIQKIATLSNTQANPLMGGLKRVTDFYHTGTHAILIKDFGYAANVRLELMENIAAPIEVITYGDLRSVDNYSTITIVGGMSLDWVPSFVISAPRTTILSAVIWNGGRTQKSFGSLLDYGLPGTETARSGSLSFQSKVQVEIVPTADNSNSEFLTYSEDLWQEAELDEFLRRTTAKSDMHDHESINVRLYLLECRNAVFLPELQSQKISVFDVDEVIEGTETGGIERVEMSEVRVGDFLVLRTQGAGDLIANVADRLMGTQAGEIRANQLRWKNGLKDLVDEKGLLEVSIMLLDCGSQRGNEPNVRNWISEDNIRPDSDEDFLSILKLLRMDPEYNQLVTECRIIDHAHRKAGHQIRKALLKKASNIDVELLIRTGRIDIELDDVDGGTLTAIRIVSVTDKTTKAPRHLTQKLISLDESQYDISL